MPNDSIHASEAWEDRVLLADGLQVARSFGDGALDLIYLDPPFGTGRKRLGLKGRDGRFGLEHDAAFDDPGPELTRWLVELLGECRRILRPGGALFLHLDWRRSAYARVHLDRLFGPAAFLNEIIWRYATGGVPRDRFARKHDTILYYRNGPGHTFHRMQEKKYLAHRMGRRGVAEFRDERGWYRFRYLDDVWDIPWITQDAKERTGYPTQKPLALVERILEAATIPGDRVGDFCCGSGTTLVAAKRLGRRWAGCDVSPAAIRIASERLARAASVPKSADGLFARIEAEAHPAAEKIDKKEKA